MITYENARDNGYIVEVACGEVLGLYNPWNQFVIWEDNEEEYVGPRDTELYQTIRAAYLKVEEQRLRAAAINWKQKSTALPTREYSSSKAEKRLYTAVRDILKARWNKYPINSLSEYKKDLHAETIPLVQIYLSLFEISVTNAALNEAWSQVFQTLYQNEGLYIIEPEIQD